MSVISAHTVTDGVQIDMKVCILPKAHNYALQPHHSLWHTLRGMCKSTCAALFSKALEQFRLAGEAYKLNTVAFSHRCLLSPLAV